MTKPPAVLALDIGGVFHGDSWETIFAAELAAFYGLDMPTVRRWGAEIWDAHAHGPSNEESYWRDWEARLGRPVDLALVHRLIERDVWVDLSVIEVVRHCLDRGIAVCIVSNNTEFWYTQEMARAGLGPYLTRLRAYLSNTTGHPKTHPQGGLALLARDYDPAGILFVDDRPDNIAAAQALGMTGLLYHRDPAIALWDVLQNHIIDII